MGSVSSYKAWGGVLLNSPVLYRKEHDQNASKSPTEWCGSRAQPTPWSRRVVASSEVTTCCTHGHDPMPTLLRPPQPAWCRILPSPFSASTVHSLAPRAHAARMRLGGRRLPAHDNVLTTVTHSLPPRCQGCGLSCSSGARERNHRSSKHTRTSAFCRRAAGQATTATASVCRGERQSGDAACRCTRWLSRLAPPATGVRSSVLIRFVCEPLISNAAKMCARGALVACTLANNAFGVSTWFRASSRRNNGSFERNLFLASGAT